MNKKVFLLGTLVLVLVLGMGLASCAQAGPEDTALNFMKAVSDMDMEKAGKYTTEEGKQLLAMMGAMTSQMSDEELSEMKGAKITVVSSQVDGDTGSVVLSVDGEENALPMTKVDGAWKVDLNKESMNKEM